MGPGDLCRVPSAAVPHGKAKRISRTKPCGECRMSCGYRARGVSIRAKFVLSRNPGYKTRGVKVLGEILFIEPQGVNEHRRPVSGAPSSSTPRESQAKLRDGTVWGL